MLEQPQKRTFVKEQVMNLNYTLRLILTLGFCLLSLQSSVAQENRPNVLIIGDSVSMGYEPTVAGMLAAEANVTRPLNDRGGQLNCEGTTCGVEKIDEWLAMSEWDVIHFNFGLHDLKHVDPETGRNSKDPNHPKQADLAKYESNLREIVKKLKATDAKLIFATTTPYPDQPGGPLRRADDVARYNEIALQIMKENEIPANDLHKFVKPRMNQLLLPNNVHFKVIGSRALAHRVAAAIRNALPDQSGTNESPGKWEHMAVHSRDARMINKHELKQEIFRRFGNEGWQLVDTVTVDQNGSTEKLIFFFKRPR